MSRALATLGILPGERRSSLLMIAHSFCMGCATVFFETAASALFLSSFEKEMLPWVYVAAAAVNIATGAVYSSVKQRVSFARLMTGTVVFLLLSVCGFRVGLAVTKAAWLMFALLVWYRVVSILTDLEYWAVAARLYDLRQAKRLFGLIGTGEVVARILGSFSVPLFVGRIGVPNLMWVSAAGLLLCLVLLLAVLPLVPRTPADAAGARPRKPSTLREQVRQVRSDSYLMVVTGLAVLAVFGKYFVDFAFLEQMRERYSDVTNLAGFFGVFSGLTQGLALLTRLLFSGPLLQRFGIRVGLLVLPLSHLVCTAILVLQGVAGGSTASQSALVFWLVIANQGIYKTLKHPIDNPSFKVLYQPLRADDRLAAQISVEAIFTPITIGVAGAIMLLMSTLVSYDPVRFSYVLLVNFAGWVLMARQGSRAYQNALVDVLQRRVIDDAALALDDATSVAILRKRLASSNPSEVIFALHLLERAEYPRTQDVLVERLAHEAPEVRRYAVERLGALRVVASLPLVECRVELEREPAPLAAALRALGALGQDTSAKTLDAFLAHPQAPVRRAALAALLGLPSAAARARALSHLRALGASAKAGDRMTAAQVLGESPAPDAEPVLIALLQDADPAVRRAALHATRSESETVVGLLIENLAQPAFAGAAAAALAQGPAVVVRSVKDRFIAGGRRSVLVQLARVLGQLGTPSALAFLRAQIGYPDEMVRTAVLEALLRHRVETQGGAERAAVERVLRQEAEHAATLLGAWRDLPDEPAFEALHRALETDVARGRERAFALLALLHEREAILRARDNIGGAARDKRAYALEILDVTLGGSQKGFLLPLLDAADGPARLSALQRYFPQPRRSPADRIAELMAQPDGLLRTWTRACGAQAAADAGLGELRGALSSLTTGDWLVLETAHAAARRLLAEVSPDAERSVPMLLIEKVMILKRVQIFQHSSEEILAEIAAALQELPLKAGEVVFQKGDAGDSLYVVVDGEVRVHDGERTVNLLGDREIFGELALLDPEPRSMSCSATRDTLLFRLDAETFSQLMAGNIEIVRGVLHVLCERLRRVTAR